MASPGIDAGRGLKQAEVRRTSGNFDASPGIDAGRGLKQALPSAGVAAQLHRPALMPGAD